MLSLQVDRLKKISLPVGTGWLLGECMEAKGKQEIWTRQRPEALAALREQAVIQSAESSNRIEGVTVAGDRLRPVVMGKSKPRDRSEEELAGYRKALDWIFSRKFGVAIAPKVILHLHSMAQGGSPATPGSGSNGTTRSSSSPPAGRERSASDPRRPRKPRRPSPNSAATSNRPPKIRAFRRC
jgi:hypothetical protein